MIYSFISSSSPQPITIYDGPEIPVAYDPNWQLFTNLTTAQIAWFQSQPEWQQFLDWVALSPSTATINAGVSPSTIQINLADGSIEI